MHIRHDQLGHRFLGETASGTAVLAYAPAGGAIELFSTYVPAAERGRGLGGELVRAAVGFAREQRLRVIPTCGFVAEWIDAHPEHQDLIQQ